MIWEPISKLELTKEIDVQCAPLDDDELDFLNSIKVELEKVKILRSGDIEYVYIVAKLGDTIIFYEDIEEGFEIATLNKNGVISDYGCNQFTVQHVVNQLRAQSS